MWPQCFVETSYTRRCPRRAFTLIEVILGSVLLSTLVVTGIHSLRLHQRQLQINEHRIEAVPIAERLLTMWSNTPEGVPVGANGILDPQRQWIWQTQLVRTQTVFGQPFMIIRFEIIENFPTPNVVLVSLELIKPMPSVVAPLVSPQGSGPMNDADAPQPEMTEPST